MNMSSRSKSQITAAPTRQKSRLTEDQLRLLEATFSQEKKLESERKFQLASQLGMPAKQVAVWYQNRRARWKTQSIEYDYLTIRQRLENSLAEREMLQTEVSRLRIKLQKSQEIISSISYNTPPPESSSLCSPSKEDSSNGSSVPVNVDCHRQSSESSSQGSELWQNTGLWKTNGSWPVEDLYACLLGNGEQTTMMSNSSSLFNPGQS